MHAALSRVTYGDDGFLGNQGEDIGTGDDAGAGGLDFTLDPVDHVEATEGVDVRVGILLSYDCRYLCHVVIQKNRGVAALQDQNEWYRSSCITPYIDRLGGSGKRAGRNGVGVTVIYVFFHLYLYVFICKIGILNIHLVFLC